MGSEEEGFESGVRGFVVVGGRTKTKKEGRRVEMSFDSLSSSFRFCLRPLSLLSQKITRRSLKITDEEERALDTAKKSLTRKQRTRVCEREK